MKTYRVEVFARMCFVVNVLDENDVNDTATNYVENNRDEFDWSFDNWREIKQ